MLVLVSVDWFFSCKLSRLLLRIMRAFWFWLWAFCFVLWDPGSYLIFFFSPYSHCLCAVKVWCRAKAQFTILCPYANILVREAEYQLTSLCTISFHLFAAGGVEGMFCIWSEWHQSGERKWEAGLLYLAVVGWNQNFSSTIAPLIWQMVSFPLVFGWIRMCIIKVMFYTSRSPFFWSF